MANTNVNVVQQIKFLLETELDEKSKIQVGKDLKSVLEDAVIAFDKSETEKNFKPIVAMINSVLKKADMPIIDEGSITASFEKIANMSADTFQEAFNAAIKNNGGIRLSFNDMKLDDIIESINKVSESIEQLGNNTSNVKKSIEKDISDINGAVERMGTGKNADKSIKDALKYKPKTAKTYNDSGTKTINELYEEYDSAINWEDKAKAIIKYKKEYESYIAYLKKNKPKEISSFSNSKYGKLYGRIGNNIDPILKALENVLVVKRQMESGDLNNRQNELVDDRNKPWARESTLKAVHETLKGGLKVSADVPDSKKQNAIESENPKVPDTEKPDVIDTPKNKKTEKTNVDKKTINKEIKQSIQSILVDVFRDAAASSSKKWENTVDGDKEKYIKSSIQKRFGLNKDVSELLMADLIYASKSTDNFDSVFSDIYKDLLSIVTSIDGVDLATFKKNIEQSLQTQEQTQPSGDVAKKETSNNNSGIGKTELTDVLNNVTVKVQVVSDKDPVPENGANEKASVTINDESLKNVLSGLIYNVHVQSGDENSLGSELQEYEKLVNEDTSKMSKEELGEHNDKIERTYDTIISFFQDQDRADVGYSVEYGIGDGEINSEDLLKLLIQKLPIRVKSDYSDLENSKISSIDEKSLKALLEEIQYKVKIVGENKVETDKSDNKLIELINKLIANGIGERGAFLSSKDGSYIGFKEGDAHSTSADIEDYKKASKNGYDTRIHFHTAKTAAPSGDNRKTKENPYGGSDVDNWVKAFDYIKKQIIVTQNELLSFDLSNLTKEQLEAVRDAYEKDVIKYKEDSSLSKDELQVKMRQSLERLLQPYVGAMTAYKLPNVVSDTLEQKGSGSATTVNASIDTKDLSSAFENSTKDLAKEETLGDVKDFVKTIADSTNNGNVQDELQVDKEIQRQIKQETGNQEQRFDRLNDIASAYADIEDVEAAIKQFGEVYKQIVLMSDVEYRNIKPNKTGINILRKIASGDFDVSDYSGIEFQRVDKPINTTKNISINTSEITDAIRDNAVDTKDLAKEETLGNIGKDLKTIIDNTKQKDAPSNDNNDASPEQESQEDNGEKMRAAIMQELAKYGTLEEALKAGGKRIQFDGSEVHFGSFVSEYLDKFLGQDFDRGIYEGLWKEARQQFYKFEPVELTKEDAINIIREKIPDNLLEGWFRKGDSEYKPLLEQAVMSDDEIRNAALNIMWSNFKEFSGKDIGFKEFLNSEIPMYRGKNSENYTEYDDLLSFSFDPKVAEKFGKYVLETLIKPIETIGSLQTTGEAEALIYRKPLESRAEYKKWHDDMANVNQNLENNTSRLLTEEDVRNAEEAYDSATRKVNILTEELIEARKELEKLQQQADLYGYVSDMSPQQVGRVRSTLSKPENAKTSQNYSRAQYVVDMLKKGYNVAKTNSGDYGFARHDIGENVYNTITKTEYDYAVYLSEKIKELNVGWEEGLKILQSQNGQLEAAQQKVTGLESALSDANSAKDVMYDAQTVIHNAYNKQQNGQTEDSTVANNQKKIKSYEELVAIVNRYFELKSKLRDINVEYADGIYGENYNPPIFDAMESIESMLENAQLDTSNMDVFNALHEDGANAESAAKRIAAAIGIEVEQQERLNESMRDGIQVRKSLNKTEEQTLLPDANKFNEKSFLDDAQKAEVVKLGEEYRVILSLLEKDDEKVSEVADALRERAKAIMNVMYAVRQNDSTPSETYKLLFGGSDAAARAISDSKKQSELVSDFDTKNIDNQSRQVAIDLIYKEVEAEKRLLAEKKSQEEAEKETYKTEFIAQYTKALEKEKSLINDIIELQKELNILEDSNDESKYSDVLRKWSDKRAELQDGNDALYSAFIDVKPSDAERYIKELQSTNAPASKSLITTDTQSKSEENDMNVLLASVNAVTDAVKLKTRAFNTERSAVQLVVEDEVKSLDVLENKLISIKQTLEGLMNNVGAGASDLASGLSNVNINVNYPENGKVEFNSTAIEQLVAAINGIPSKQQAATTTAVGNVPATENTLLIIKESVAAINNKMGKGTKSAGGYKKTTKSDYTGSAFFGEKIKTRELELGKFVQQLNNAGKNTQKLQDMIRQLQTALQAVNSGESLSVYDQMFRQVKLLVSIDDLQRAPAEKDKIADYKQLIKFAKEYYKLVEKYEKAEDGSNRKRVLGNQKDAIEKFMSDNGINLGNIAFDDENYNKQLSDLRIKHSNNMAEIDAANKDKSNKKALQEEQAEVKKLIDLYRALGEEVTKRDYAETKESKDAHQQTINEIAKKIRGNAYYDKVNKQDAINAMRESAANKSASLRQSQADKAGAQRVRDENKALKEQEQTITELEAMYKNLGKAMAEVEVNGDLKKKERASQLQKEIDTKIQGLKLAKDEEDTLREKLNIIKETEKENSKALLVAQNKQKDNKKRLNKQVRTSRQKARIGRANSSINGAEDAIYNAMVIDSVDASEVAVVQSLNTELEKLKGLYAAIQANDGVVSESDAQQLVNQTRLVKAHATELNKLLQQYERLSGDNVKEIVSYDAKGNLEKQLINAAKAATNGRAEIKGFNEETGELVAIVKGEKNSFTECTYAVREYDNQIVQVTGTTKKMEGFMDGILRKMKEIFMYFSGSSVVYKLFNELRQGIQYVREIDSALTELKKVTDETDESYSKFLDTASKTADKVGSTIKDIVSSTADWARLGFSLEDAANLAESTSILLNVSEFQSIDDATSALVSTMQAFGYAAKDSMHVVDVMNEIGKLLPIDNYIG